MSEVKYLHPPTVWLLTDNKPGHRNQLKGIGERLEALAGASLVWIDAGKHRTALWQVLLGAPPPLPYAAPNIIIAAGSGTHRLLLALRRKRKVIKAVLMRPNFPVNWIDAAIVPAHDHPPARRDVLQTQGALNAVTPNAGIVTDTRGLILLGGPSRHYIWDDEMVYEQVAMLSESYADWNWYLTSSRRTPESLINRLRQASLPNVHFFHHEETDPGWVAETMAEVRVAWVTPDSVSMVYEALTAGLPTGLLELETAAHSRVTEGVAELERNGRVAPWTNRKALMNADPQQIETLWEADRAARWLLERWQQAAL